MGGDGLFAKVARLLLSVALCVAFVPCAAFAEDEVSYPVSFGSQDAELVALNSETENGTGSDGLSEDGNNDVAVAEERNPAIDDESDAQDESDESDANTIAIVDEAAEGEGSGGSAEADRTEGDQKETSTRSTIDPVGAGTEYVADEVLVVYKDGTSAEEATAVAQETEAISTQQVSSEEVADDTTAVVLDVAEDSSVPDAVAELEQNPQVEYVQPNYLYELNDEEQGSNDAEAIDTSIAELAPQGGVTVNDPLFSSSSGDNWQWYIDALNIDDAWGVVKCSGSVGVGVIDSGYDTDHPDLSGPESNIKAARNYTNEGSVDDGYGHGTHVAGLIGATANNEIGVAGASYNATVIPVKIFQSNGGLAIASSKALQDSYLYLRTVADAYNIRVINLSLGANGGISDDNVVKNQIDAAYDEGILTVAAAGNYSVDYAAKTVFPGDYATCLTVINITKEDKRCSSSNYSSLAKNTVSAYGSLTDYSGIISCTKGGGYGLMKGTSMSAPLVSSVAALIFAANPSLSAVQVKDLILSTATDIGASGWDAETGYGKVNAYAAVTSALGSDITGSGTVMTGSTATYTLSDIDSSQVSWSVDNGNLASIDASGKLTPKANGQVSVIAKAYDRTWTKKITIKTDITHASVSSIATQTENFGQAIKPKTTVKIGTTTLIEGTDYTLSYSSNVKPGTATINATGKGYYTGSFSKQFKISAYAAKTIADGAYTIRTKLNSNRLIDISARSLANGGNAQMYTGNQTPAQRFYLQWHAADGNLGYYTLKNVCSGKYLDVSGAGTANGTNVQQYTGNNTAAQRWVLVASSQYSGYYVLKNVASGKVLDISGNSTANGANLQIYQANNTSAQAFYLINCKQSAIASTTTYALKSDLNSRYVIDVAGANAANGANIQIYSFNGTNAQRFSFSYNDNDGYYTVRSSVGAKVLDAAAAGMQDGTNVQTYTSNNTWAQRWSVVKSGNSYMFYNACNGLCLDVSAGRAANSSNVQCWTSNGTNAQKWTLSR